MNLFSKKKLSVIIPIYNTESYLTACLESVVKGVEGLSAEIILVDDGSTDNSSAIAKEFSSKNHDFRYIRTQNLGVGAARNTGIRKAKGEYLAFVDSDDKVVEGIYVKLIQSAESIKADMAIMNVDRFNAGKSWASILHKIVFDGLNVPESHISKYSKFVYDTIVCNKVIKRSVWTKGGYRFPEGVIYEDMPVSLRLHNEVNTVAVLNEIGYRWRVREACNNKSATQTTDRLSTLLDRIKAIKSLLEYAESNMRGMESGALEELKYKSLSLDLIMFVDKCVLLEKKYAEEFMTVIREFLLENFTEQDLIILSEGHQKKYDAIINDDLYLLRKIYGYS